MPSGEQLDHDHPDAPVDGTPQEQAPPAPTSSDEQQVRNAAGSVKWTFPKNR